VYSEIANTCRSQPRDRLSAPATARPQLLSVVEGLGPAGGRSWGRQVAGYKPGLSRSRRPSQSRRPSRSRSRIRIRSPSCGLSCLRMRTRRCGIGNPIRYPVPSSFPRLYFFPKTRFPMLQIAMISEFCRHFQSEIQYTTLWHFEQASDMHSRFDRFWFSSYNFIKNCPRYLKVG
jgi:hypothetical protein